MNAREQRGRTSMVCDVSGIGQSLGRRVDREESHGQYRGWFIVERGIVNLFIMTSI